MSYQCSKCNSDMEEGFILESTEGPSWAPDTWIAGKPEKTGFFPRLNLKGKDAYDVKTFRCITCGYLDSYALVKKWADGKS